jgi:anti-sigma regulatory factor (Ser/Thr protein kinase)
MYDILGTIVDDRKSPSAPKITLDFRTLGFIRPVGCVVLSNLVEWLSLNGTKCFFKWPPPSSSKAVKYLDDSKFFLDYLGEYLDETSSPRQTTVPLQRVAHQKSYGWLVSEFVPWLSSRLKMSEDSFSSIKTCLGEIFNNINDHAGEGIEVGCFFAQHYPREDRVQVAVSDFGRSIPVNVRSAYDDELNDGEAILKATEEGFTTQSQPDNRGAGLSTLLREVVENNGGELYIHSARGTLACTGDGTGGVHRAPGATDGYYPGTLFSISFRTDTIENIPQEEFRW